MVGGDEAGSLGFARGRAAARADAAYPGEPSVGRVLAYRTLNRGRRMAVASGRDGFCAERNRTLVPTSSARPAEIVFSVSLGRWSSVNGRSPGSGGLRRLFPKSIGRTGDAPPASYVVDLVPAAQGAHETRWRGQRGAAILPGVAARGTLQRMRQAALGLRRLLGRRLRRPRALGVLDARDLDGEVQRPGQLDGRAAGPGLRRRDPAPVAAQLRVGVQRADPEQLRGQVQLRVPRELVAEAGGDGAEGPEARHPDGFTQHVGVPALDVTGDDGSRDERHPDEQQRAAEIEQVGLGLVQGAADADGDAERDGARPAQVRPGEVVLAQADGGVHGHLERREARDRAVRAEVLLDPRGERGVVARARYELRQDEVELERVRKGAADELFLEQEPELVFRGVQERRGARQRGAVRVCRRGGRAGSVGCVGGRCFGGGFGGRGFPAGLEELDPDGA